MVWTPRTTVAAIVEKEGKFLFVRERFNGTEVLNQPAGHLEDNESLVEALQREVLEETAWTIQPESIIGIYRLRLAEKDRTYLRYCFSAKALEQTDNMLDPDILGTEWLTLDELDSHECRPRSSMVKRSLQDYLNGASYPLDILRD